MHDTLILADEMLQLLLCACCGRHDVVDGEDDG
jgi:hypothetical protein